MWELVFTKVSDGHPRIATARVKHNEAYQKKLGVTTHRARGLTPEQDEAIRRLCKRIYRSLGLNGYARMDLRMTPEGRIYVLEANPNPELAYGEDFAESAEAAGISYEQLVQRIVNLGLRWGRG